MKVPRQLPQFKNEQALLIVTGMQQAEVFLAGDGRLDMLEEFRLQRPRYTDKEGLFLTSGRGRVYSRGATQKDVKDELRQKFLSELDSHLKNLAKKHQPNFLYVFCPDYLHNDVAAIIKNWFKTKPEIFPGNYFKQPPLKLLQKVQDAIETKIQTLKKGQASAEAQKILERGK